MFTITPVWWQTTLDLQQEIWQQMSHLKLCRGHCTKKWESTILILAMVINVFYTFIWFQRLSVCLALAFLYMISNAMFYKDEINEQDKPVSILGLFEINFQAIYVATITSLIMIPANLLVVTIFRKARQRKCPNSIAASKKTNLQDMTEVSWHIGCPKKNDTLTLSKNFRLN